MSAIRQHSLLLFAIAVLAAGPAAQATEQVMDRVRFEGKDRWMVENPLNPILAKLPDDYEFDFQRTSNWKGYVARWEVKDGILSLVSFEARRDGKPVPLETILPDRKLPTRADWFTGRLRILVGEPVDGWEQGLYGTVIDRVAVLQVEKGKVVKTEVVKNFRIKSRSEERDERRSRTKLWPFPRLEAGTVQVLSGSLVERLYIVNATPEALRRTPAWADGAAEPPFSPLRAMLRADAASRAALPAGARYTWDLEDAAIKVAPGGRHYYEFKYRSDPPDAVSKSRPPYLKVLVLMDGTVPRPVPWDAADLWPSLRAGAFDVDERSAGQPPVRPDPEWPRGAWSEVPWQTRLYLMARIAAAPKLLYEVEKLEVHKNGVWVEYAVTNWTAGAKFFAPEFLAFPVADAGLWDKTGEKWWVPRPRRDIKYDRPTEFVSIGPGATVRYRALLSDRSTEPLELALPPRGRQPGKPASLEYFVAGWPTAYSRLTEREEAEVNMFAFGYGRVQVTWSDKDYPESWPRTELLTR